MPDSRYAQQLSPTHQEAGAGAPAPKRFTLRFSLFTRAAGCRSTGKSARSDYEARAAQLAVGTADRGGKLPLPRRAIGKLFVKRA